LFGTTLAGLRILTYLGFESPNQPVDGNLGFVTFAPNFLGREKLLAKLIIEERLDLDLCISYFALEIPLFLAFLISILLIEL